MWRRSSLLALIMLAVIVGAVVQVTAQLSGRPAATSRAPAVGTGPATAAAPPAQPAGRARDVVRSLAAVQAAFNAGDVRRLCRPGAMLDPAVIRQQKGFFGGCESELEGLIATQPPLRLAVRRVTLRPDLASTIVGTAKGTTVSVDLVRDGRRWLVSFSDGDDPMSALAGTA